MNAQPQNNDESAVSPAAATAPLLDGFDRVHELVPAVVEGLTSDDLAWRPDQDANPIGWLLWHLLRVEDDHLADLAGSEQVWTRDGWSIRFALPYDESDIGFGQDSHQVGQFFVKDPTVLIGYDEAVHARTHEIVSRLTEADFERVVDDSYDPPVTIGARLVSVVNDTTQHIGQASYVRGLLERRGQ